MQLAVVEFSRNVLGWQGNCLLKNLLHFCLNVSGRCEARCLLGDWEPWRRAGLVSQYLVGCGSRELLFIEGKQGSSKWTPGRREHHWAHSLGSSLAFPALEILTLPLPSSLSLSFCPVRKLWGCAVIMNSGCGAGQKSWAQILMLVFFAGGFRQITQAFWASASSVRWGNNGTHFAWLY